MRARRSNVRSIGAFIGLLCLTAAITIAHAAAADKPAPPRGAAPSSASTKPLLERALAAESAHELTTAVELLTAAYRQSPQPEVLYHLGRIAILEGRLVDAHDLYRRYLADPARQPDDAAVKTAELVLAQKPPPSGNLSVLSEPGALVIVDKRVVGTLPLPQPLLLTPGMHQVGLEFLDKRLDASVEVQASRLIELRITRPSGTVLLSVLPAILHLVDAKELPSDAARLLSDALGQAARVEQHTLLSVERALALAPELGECIAEDRCQRELAQKNNLELRLQQRTQIESGTNYKTELSLWRMGLATPAATASSSCAPCDAKQAAAKLKEAAAKLFSDGIARPYGTLALKTDPPAAEVRLGEQKLSRSAAVETLWAMTYELSVRHKGYVTEQRTVTIHDGKQTELQVQLERSSGALDATNKTQPRLDSAQAPLGRPRWRLGVGGAMLALGVGLAIVGGVGLSQNGQCVETPPIEGAACPRLYTTQAAGGIGIGLGAALIGGGIGLIALPGRPRAPSATAKTATAR